MKHRNWIKNSLKPVAVALLCFALLLPTLTTHAEEETYEPIQLDDEEKND